MLSEILTYHVADGKVLSSDLTDNQLIDSLQGKQIRINIYKNGTVSFRTFSDFYNFKCELQLTRVELL